MRKLHVSVKHLLKALCHAISTNSLLIEAHAPSAYTVNE